MNPNLDQERLARTEDAIELALFGNPAEDLRDVAKAAILAYLGHDSVVVPRDPSPGAIRAVQRVTDKHSFLQKIATAP